VSEHITNIKPTKGHEADYRNFGPIRVCPCGSEWFDVICKFDDEYKIGVYFTDARCISCDSLVKVVTEVDKEN